jgi:antitoxin component YwqK of YwqJK toxin-antitoxin module
MDIWDYFNQIDVTGYHDGLGECMRETYRSLTFTWHGAAKCIAKAAKNELLKEPKTFGLTNMPIRKPAARDLSYVSEGPVLITPEP